jgi:cytochrome bd-type quinol oxidase subunit 1
MQALINAGGGLLIALVILIGLYRLADKHGAQFIEAQQSQAAAMGKQAEAMEEMKTSIKEFIGRDNSEHREILILQKMTIDKLKDLEGALNGREKG